MSARAARSLLLAAFALVASAPAVLTACAGRTVEVSTGPDPAPGAASVEVTNNLAQAVNVYVRAGSGSEVFVRQVPGRTTEQVPVRGVRAGTAVTLRIAPVDGAAGYTRENVAVGQGAAVRVP